MVARAGVPPPPPPPPTFSLSACLSVVTQPLVLLLLSIKATGALAMAIWHTNITLIAKDDFQLGTTQIGLLMSYSGVVGMAIQGLQLVRVVTERVSDRAVSVAAGCVIAACFALFPLCAAHAGEELQTPAALGPLGGIAFQRSTAELVVVMVPVAAAMQCYRAVSTAQLTKAVNAATSGTVIGLDMGVGSLARMLAPAAALYAGGLGGISHLCAALMLAMAAASAAALPGTAPPAPPPPSRGPSISRRAAGGAAAAPPPPEGKCGGVTFSLLIVYVNIAMYSFCYQMQMPVLPARVHAIAGEGDLKTAWAKFQTSFWLMQLLGGLVSGVLSDRFGSKWLFLVSFAASAACYALQAVADGMGMLYLSQVPTLFQHAFMGATAYITDSTHEARRAHLIGYIGMAYGVGMAFGPALGGWLGKSDLRKGPVVATIGSLLSCALIIIFLDAPQKQKRRQD